MMRRRRQRDYHKKEYKNPLFSNRESQEYYKTSARRWRQRIMIVLLAIILVFWLGIIIYSDFFKIKNFEIAGLGNIEETDFREIVNNQLRGWNFFILPRNNIWFFNKSSLKKALDSKYSLEKLSIQKDLPDGLKIEVKEKISVIIWSRNDEYYYLDFKGVVISEIPIQNLRSGFPLVYDERAASDGKIKINEEIIPKKIAETIIGITEKTGAESDVKIAFMKLEDNNGLKAMTEEGWEIYFDLNQPAEKQVKNLISVLKEKIKENRQNLEYIDLRFGEKIFYSSE